MHSNPTLGYLHFIGDRSQAERTLKKKNLSLRSWPGEEITPAPDSQTSALSTRAFQLPILLIFNYGSNGSGCSFVFTLGRLCLVIAAEEKGGRNPVLMWGVWLWGWNSLPGRDGGVTTAGLKQQNPFLWYWMGNTGV